MTSLIITPAALELIRSALDRSRVQDPVVYLIEVSEEIRVSPQLGKAIVDRADENAIRQIAAKELSDVSIDRPRRLVPAIYSRKQFPGRYVRTIEGMPFVTPPTLASKLQDATLDAVESGLQLRDSNGAIVMPR